MSIRITPTTANTTANRTPEPRPIQPATPTVPPTSFGTCKECTAELTPLLNDKGQVRTVFCEYCEFGI
ncbi:hypothetical protein AQJ11_03045 [Streptomyces corchorusii]|uniref:Uncharacterized protein n=3 Tax=Streptomyces TaxID=1883 RepID=A0A124HPK7_STRCK|nr:MULTISPECIES: hypothetical protein [Streptomyces]KUN32517.1 hypothetical protein AQJ11_03045 [Streptomyces corchorusii]GHA08916.1 hypothetical protein GCM10010345_11630 [Streptomyces canarius]